MEGIEHSARRETGDDRISGAPNLAETGNPFDGVGTARQDIREWPFCDADHLYPTL
jgi:hypothetical protein